MKGIHLPNRELVANELDRIVSLGCTHYVDLHYWPHRWKELKTLQPDCKIHVRIDKRGPLTPNDDIRDVYLILDNNFDYIDTIRIRNEPNVESQNSAEEWSNYLSLYIKGMVNTLSKVSLPAISPDLHGWETWYSSNAKIAAEYKMKYLDAHIYGNIGEFEEILFRVEEIWNGNILITEHNFGAGRRYPIAQWAADYLNIVKLMQFHPNIKCLCEFIWEWNNPDMILPALVNIKDTMMESTIRNLVIPVPAVQIDEQRKIELKVLPKWYLACIEVGEDWTHKTKEDFVNHLKGVGGDWKHPERYGWV